MSSGVGGVRLDPSDTRFFDPTRDFAYLFPKMLIAVRDNCLAGRAWSGYRELFGPNAPPDAEVGRALDVYLDAAAGVVDGGELPDVLDRLGWFKLSAPARYAVQIGVGQVALQVYADCAKRATLGGRGPADELAHVRGLAAASAVMSLPPWRRTLARVCRRFARLGGLFRGSE